MKSSSVLKFWNYFIKFDIENQLLMIYVQKSKKE